MVRSQGVCLTGFQSGCPSCYVFKTTALLEKQGQLQRVMKKKPNRLGLDL